MKKHSNFEYIKMIFSMDKRLLGIMIFSVLSTVVWDLMPIGIVAYILSIYQKDPTQNGFLLIVIICGVFALVKVLFSGFSMFIYNQMTNRINRRLSYLVNKKLYEKIESIDYETYQSSEFLNNYQKVLDNGVSNMIDTYWNFSNIVERIISLLSLGTIFSLINPLIMVYGVVCGVIGYFISIKISKLYHTNSEKNKQNIRERGYVRRVFYLKEPAVDLRTTNINSLYLDMNDEIGDKVIKNIDKYILKVNIYSSLNEVLMQSILAFSLAFITSLVIETQNIVILASLVAAVSSLSNGIWSLSAAVSAIKESIIYKQDYYRVMDTECGLETTYDHNITSLGDFNKITFDNVFFGYGDKPVLNNITLSINKGDRIAVVGENGAGKTTLVKLLLRLYDPNKGDIKYNNYNYKDIDPNLIRDNFNTVFQNYQIYAVSIAENVLMRKLENEDDERIVEEALKKVGLLDKIKSYDEGIRTICTKEFDENGIEFSGGERQKLVLARIFASASPIILLDEPNSALDPLAEKHIFDEIFQYTKDKTLIFISHRFSTTVNVDKIYLFKEGEIFESGSHEELMNIQNGEYRRMFNVQAEEYIKKGEKHEDD